MKNSSVLKLKQTIIILQWQRSLIFAHATSIGAHLIFFNLMLVYKQKVPTFSRRGIIELLLIGLFAITYNTR